MSVSLGKRACIAKLVFGVCTNCVCGMQNLVGLVIWWIILFGASALFVVQYQNGLKREQREKERR